MAPEPNGVSVRHSPERGCHGVTGVETMPLSKTKEPRHRWRSVWLQVTQWPARIGPRYPLRGLGRQSEGVWTRWHAQKKLRDFCLEAFCKSVAATYSPTWWGSTIGDGELNFSVRNGKRWILTAITATICFWEKTTRNWLDAYRAVFHSVFLAYFSLWPRSLRLSLQSRVNRRTHRGRCRAISTARLWHYCL